MVEMCVECTLDSKVSCKRDADVVCRHCGALVCGGHVLAHLREKHCVAVTNAHCAGGSPAKRFMTGP